VDFSFFSNSFNMQGCQKFHGKEVQSLFGNVGEVLPARRRIRAVHVCWYFLTITDKIRKRSKDTVVALHPESIPGIVFSQGTEV